ncbi:hypothetical protein BH09ACT12_BH09ACT12_02880 [soil metagenome]
MKSGMMAGSSGMGNTLNVVVAAIVGATAATALTVGGVNAAKGDQKPVAQSKLSQYSEK